MINFVVCEDNKVVLQKNVDIINRVMFKNNINYRDYSFSNYSKELKDLINSDIGQVIYILDIELEDASGLDIASEIRKKDLDSFIIISTSYIDYLPYTLKSKLMLFDFVSKFADYCKSWQETFGIVTSGYIVMQADLTPIIDFVRKRLCRLLLSSRVFSKVFRQAQTTSDTRPAR